ncbi:hypothetical protein ACC685_39530, partial [Rhizobium ruizarguesonis]
SSLGELLSKGYQIKAAIPNCSKFVVFMQKDQSAYACEMQSLTASRCGTLNLQGECGRLELIFG